MKLNVQSSTSEVYVYHYDLTLPFDIYSPISELSYIRRYINSKCESIFCFYFAYKLLLHGTVTLLYNYELFLTIPTLLVDEMTTTFVEESYLCFTQLLSLAVTVENSQRLSTSLYLHSFSSSSDGAAQPGMRDDSEIGIFFITYYNLHSLKF